MNTGEAISLWNQMQRLIATDADISYGRWVSLSGDGKTAISIYRYKQSKRYLALPPDSVACLDGTGIGSVAVFVWRHLGSRLADCRLRCVMLVFIENQPGSFTEV